MDGSDDGRVGHGHPDRRLMTWDRRGGHAAGPTGDRITWSLAEGARGTRWREAASRDGVLIRSIVLEVAPAGAVMRLEVATAEGLLTLHPEPDASAMHGNVVTPHGIRHLSFDWSPSHELVVAGSFIADAVAVRRIAVTLPVGGHAEVDVLVIDDALQPRPDRWAIERTASDRWTFQPRQADNPGREIRVGPDGLPMLDAAETWALEA